MKQKGLLLVLILLLVSSGLWAQDISITGKVTDKADNSPIIGVSVGVKGRPVGTMTDANGQFSVKVKTTDILVFSFVGMVTQEVPVANKKVINVSLASDAKTIDEVVVVGYGVMKKSDLTGSVAKVNVQDLKKVSTIDAAQAIQGKIAGVNVISNSGNPGSGATIRVRGVGTVNNSDPLYVVDGFPVSDISHIAPTDIESMEVLKDASATAIYGSRGANGVILVKTRTGSKGSKFEVQANAFVGVSQVAKTLDLADATEFALAKKEIGQADDMINYVIDSKNNGTYLKGTDWQKEILRNALSQRYNVSILGSGENYSYDHGMTYSDQDGIVKGTNLEKVMFHSNNVYSLAKNVKLGANFNYVWYEKPIETTDFYNGTIPGALRADPISTAWDPYTNFYGQVYYSTSISNPALAIWKNKMTNQSENRFIGNFFLQIDDILVKGLSFRAQFGKLYQFTKDKNYSPKYNITPTQKQDKSSLYEKRFTAENWTNTNYFSYNGMFLDKLSVGATLGMEVQAYKNDYISATGYDVPEDANLQYLATHKDATSFSIDGAAGQNRLASGFFRSNLTWDNRYLITGTIRLDGSSKFLSNKRWGWFPSFSAGWNVNNERFFENIKNTVSSLKVRAGWGIVGNQSSAGDFDYVSSMVNGYTYAFNKTANDGSIQKQLNNVELTWESAEQYNIGLDYGFFNNTLTGTVDYFDRRTKDMIISRPIPIYAGKQRPNVNAGTMSNKGVELSVNYSNSIHDFKYSAGVNLTFIKNEVTSLAGGDPIRSGAVGRVGNTTKTEVGREIAYFYGYKTGGIFKTAEQLAAYKKNGVAIQPNAQLGDVVYIDNNNDGKIDDNDMTYLGSATPDFTGGFNLNLSYKNIDLALYMNGSYGNEIVNGMYQTLYSSRMFETNISRDMAVNHWSPSNSNSNVPRLTASDPNKNDETFTDRMVEDGSYLRLKNLQIGYTLPANLAKKLFMKQLRVYASFDNLVTFTKYTGLDPELYGMYSNPFYSGVDMVNYPQPRTYSLGINLTF